jgi:hypothetical protein
MLIEHRFWDKISQVYEISFQNEKLYVSFNDDLNFLRVYRKNSEWKFYTFMPGKKKWENDLPPYRIPDQNYLLSQFLINISKNDLDSNKIS